MRYYLILPMIVGSGVLTCLLMMFLGRALFVCESHQFPEWYNVCTLLVMMVSVFAHLGVYSVLINELDDHRE